MSALIGLIPDPVAKRRHVGWSAAGARSMRKPLPITGETETSAPTTACTTGECTTAATAAYELHIAVAEPMCQHV